MMEIQSNGHDNLEQEAIRALAEARKLRETACMEEVNAALAKHNCQLIQVFTISEKQVLIANVVNLPHQVLIVSK